jgi:serine protease
MNRPPFVTIRTIASLFTFLVSLQLLFAQSAPGLYFRMPEGITKEDFIEGKIIFKMKEETAPYLKSTGIHIGGFEKALEEVNANGLKKMFPSHQPPAKQFHPSGQRYSDLSRIYYASVPDGVSLEDAINRLYMTNLIEYAQPWYLPQTFFEPDDPFIGSQYYLSNIKAYEAWAVEQGDTNMVIAVIDTGIDLQHPDLIANIAYNYNDPKNGKDSDNDGYIDNFHGWDLGENDNNPQYNVNAHGVHVAGIAGASTNNGTGMAGVGFNSRILPLKISDSDGRLVRSYEAIVYAADQGAKVINCSWGGAMSPGQFGQDIVNYAVLNRDAVVVASAGNSNNQVRIFPASYVNAISVAATTIDDHKWSGSSYGRLVDISAPGANIFSTWPNGSYIPSSGTSMAAPVVSGAAALLRAHFPHYNALQIAAQLKVTADNIDAIPENVPYAGLMGTGRLNIHRALTETHHPYLMFGGLQYPMDHYQLFNPGETFDVGAEFFNLLATAENMSAILTTTSPHIEVVEAESILGEIVHNETSNNFHSPFKIRIKENIPPSHEVTFTVSFFNQLGVYAGAQNFTMTFNLDYVDFQNNQIATTVNSRGNVGYNYPDYNQGVGLLYVNANQNRNLLNAAGILAGVSTSSVVDNVYGPVENSFTNSFHSTENARVVNDPPIGDMMVKGSFTDSLAGNFKVGLKFDYRIYAFQEAYLDKFMILEYDIINQSGDNKPGLHVGYFADWVIQDVRNHRASFDADNRMGYAFSANGGNFTGIQLLSHSNVRHYAFDNQGFGGSLKISDGFTSFEKYTAMKSSRDNAGFFDKDNNISTLLSAGPFNLQGWDTLKIAFSIVVGDHLNDLQANAQLAALIYGGDFPASVQSIDQQILDFRIFPNPVQDKLSVSMSEISDEMIELSVYDMSARKIYSGQDLFRGATHGYDIDVKNWKSGTYILQLKTPGGVHSLKFLKD